MAQLTFRRSLVLALTLAGLGACEVLPEHPGADGGQAVDGTCVTGGCSGQLCVNAADEPLVTTCEWREEYACYETASCAVQANGECGWSPTQDLQRCLEAAQASPTEPTPVEPPTPSQDECQRSGCSGQLCLDADAEPLATTCEWREEYACYADASCEKQSDGHCGWTPTSALEQCLTNAGSVAQ